MKINNFFILFILVAAVVVSAVIGIIISPNFLTVQNNQVGCTMEAKICPDGSAVGRTGANCEFAKCPEAPDFGSLVNFTIGKQIKFKDGLTVTLTQINDSRCKSGMVCIWAGELSPILSFVGGNVGNLQQEVHLGTLTAKQATKNGYIFELKDASETSVTIIITKEPKNLSACYIGGCSGEICSDRQDIVSSCIYKKEYGCYKTAKCERQANSQCGWTQTSALTACLNSSK